MTPLGTVAELWRYPVKSMLGERLAEARLGERGLAGDRAWVVRDQATGHVASAKLPSKWGKLFACRAAYVAEPGPEGPPPPVRITFPDGSSVTSGEPGADAALSRFLGRAVELRWALDAPPTRETARAGGVEAGLSRAAPAGTFFDYAPVHLLTTATLAALAARAPGSRFEAPRFRPNLVIDTGVAAGFVENAWPGRALRLGEGLRLQVIDPTPRCVMTTLAQGDLPADPAVLKTVGAHSRALSATMAPGQVLSAAAGCYAKLVEAGGLVRLGDALRPA